MAFERLGMTRKYLCLSTDVKLVDVFTGSTALETDTGDMYIFNGAAWVLKADNVKVTGSSVAVIYGVFAVGAAAVTKAITNRLCTVNVLSGNCWINPSAAAVADATAIKLTLATGNTLDLIVAGDLSLISDATGASVQIIVWA